MSLVFRCDGCETEFEEDKLFTVRVCIETPVEHEDDPMDVVAHLCENCLCDTETRKAFFDGLDWEGVIDAVTHPSTE